MNNKTEEQRRADWKQGKTYDPPAPHVDDAWSQPQRAQEEPNWRNDWRTPTW